MYFLYSNTEKGFIGGLAYGQWVGWCVGRIWYVPYTHKARQFLSVKQANAFIQKHALTGIEILESKI